MIFDEGVTHINWKFVILHAFLEIRFNFRQKFGIKLFFGASCISCALWVIHSMHLFIHICFRNSTIEILLLWFKTAELTACEWISFIHLPKSICTAHSTISSKSSLHLHLLISSKLNWFWLNLSCSFVHRISVHLFLFYFLIHIFVRIIYCFGLAQIYHRIIVPIHINPGPNFLFNHWSWVFLWIRFISKIVCGILNSKSRRFS